MPNLYARTTALPNVVGRVDYISSPHRQERLLAAYDGAADLLGGQFWHHLAQESQAAFQRFGQKERNGEELKCCEGREIMIMLSNSLLNRMSPEEIVKTVVDEFQEKLGLPVAAGLHLKHFSHKPDNLHVHVVFPERKLLEEPEVKIAERNLFFDADGRRVYKKSEILDEEKQLLPGCSIIKKGEIYEQRYFGSVDQQYSSKSWMQDVKTNVILPLRNGKLRGDVEITEFDPNGPYLAQIHVPSGDVDVKDDYEDYNAQVKRYNRLVDTGYVDAARTQEIKERLQLSPRKNIELRAVLAEIMRENKPQMETRPFLDITASRAASPSMTDKAENWEEKQKLRELYKERADLRSQIADMEPGMYRDLKKSELVHLNKRIEEQREKALGSKDLRMAQKIGRELGFTRKEVALIYDAVPFFSEEEWARLWKNAAEGIKRYREKLEELARAQADYLVHLAEWRRYEKYRWVLDPRNHRSKSILGMLVAIVALSFMRSRGEILSDKEYAWAVKRGLIDDIRGKRRIDPVEEERLRLLGLKIQKAVDEIRAFREWEKNGRQGPRPGTEPLEEMDFADAAEQIESQWQWWENMHPDFMQAIAEQQAKDKPQSGNHDDHNDFDSL